MNHRSHLFLLLVVVITGLFPCTSHAHREARTINSGWYFTRSEKPVASDYSPVAIPHTWNTDAYTVKDYYRGTAWYRKALDIPGSWKDRKLYLRFEAVSKHTRVYINDQLAGEHKGGYTAFALDITPFCSFTEANEITVCVDNASEDIPPISGDFTFFGGIYRDVWLITVPQQHFNLQNHGSNGVFIQTPRVSEDEASLTIKSEVKNDANEKARIEIEHILYAPTGEVEQRLQKSVVLKAGELYTHHIAAAPIRKPRLWTPETPALYRVKTILRNAKTQEVLDEVEHHTGFRWFRFDGNEGFFLNGKPYKLHGICRHQDQKPIGPALTDEMHRRDMLLMKEMGANFIRISHYPQDAAILEQCDKLGMLAWEEIPIIDIVPDAEGYPATCEQNLREMIRQHYNHPSIITWGYMNEILLVTQRRYKTPEEQKPILERTLALARRLETVLKEEDPYRNSTMAFHGSDSYNKVGLGSITDIVGWNLYQGWYGGNLTGFERFLEEQHNRYPSHPLIVSEYGAGSDKRLHSLKPKSFDFSIEYQQKYLEHYLPVIEQTPYICGGTYWNFIDFASALRDESMPRINNKGLTYANRTPKDAYYYYKAMWRRDIPVLHIASRDWMHRAGVQQGDDPVVLPVKVYTNLPEIALFIDGKCIGKQKSENCTATFEVPFSQKEHFVRATGFRPDGTVQEDGLNLYFTPTPACLTSANIDHQELAVNVGSDCFYTSDESGLTWLPDQPYTAGGWGYIGGKAEGTQTEIKNTTDGPLFQTLRSNIEGYRLDAPQGVYEIELLFTDIFKKNSATVYQLGRGDSPESQENAFSITINGVIAEATFAPARESGYFHSLRRKYVITNAQERIDIRFNALNGKCFLNGIKLRKLY